MDAPENDKTDLTLDDYREQFFSLQNAEERTRWVLAVTSYFEKNPPPSGELAWSAVLGLSAELEVEKEDRALLESLQSHIQNSIANNSDPERALAEGVKVFSEVATRIQSKSVGSRPEFLKKAHQVISTELEKRVHDGSVLEHLALVSHTLSTQLPYLEWLHIKRLEIEALRNHFTHSSSLFLPDRLRTWNHVGRLRSLDSKLFHDTCQAMGAELQKCKPDEFSGSDLRHLVVLIDTFRSAGLGRLATTLAEKVVEIVAAVDANKLKLLFAPGDGDKKNFQETALLIAGAFTEPQLPGDWPGMALLAKSFVPFAQFGDCRRLIFRPIAEKKLQSPELGPLAADDIPHVFSLVDSFHRMSQAFPLGSSFRRFSDELRDDALTRVFNRIGDIRDPEALIEADKHCRYSAAGQWAILHCAKAAERIVKTSQETNSENLERESQQLETVGRWIDRLPDRNEYSQARRLVTEWRDSLDDRQREHAAAVIEARRAKAKEEEARREEGAKPVEEKAAVVAETAKPAEKETKHPAASPTPAGTESSSAQAGEGGKEIEEKTERATKSRRPKRAAKRSGQRVEASQSRSSQSSASAVASNEPVGEVSNVAQTGKGPKKIEERTELATTTKGAKQEAKGSVNQGMPSRRPPAHNPQPVASRKREGETSKATQEEAAPPAKKAAKPLVKGGPSQDSASHSAHAVASIEPAGETSSVAEAAKRAKEKQARLEQEKQAKLEEAAAKRAKEEEERREQEEAVRHEKEEKARLEREAAAKIVKEKDAIRAAVDTTKDDSFFNDGGERLRELFAISVAGRDAVETTAYLEALHYACSKLPELRGVIGKKAREKLRANSAKALTKAADDILASDFDVAKKIEFCTRILDALGKIEKGLGNAAAQSIAKAMTDFSQGDLLAAVDSKRLFGLLGSLGPWRDAKDYRGVEAIVLDHGFPEDGSLTAEYYAEHLHPHWETAPVSERLEKWLDALNRASILGEENGAAVCQTIAGSLASTKLADKDLQAVNPLALCELAIRLDVSPQDQYLRPIWEHLSSENLSSGRIESEDLSKWADLLWSEQPDKLAEDKRTRDNIETLQNAAPISKKVWRKVRQMIMAGTRDDSATTMSDKWESLLKAQPEDVREVCSARPWLRAYLSKNAPPVPNSYNDAKDMRADSLIGKRKHDLLSAIKEFSFARVGLTPPVETASRTSDSEASTDILESEEPSVPQPSSSASVAKESEETGALILAITTALSAKGNKAVKATRKVRVLIKKHWPDNVAAGLSLLDDPRWPKAISDLLEKRFSDFTDLLRIPINDHRSDKFNHAIGHYFNDERTLEVRVGDLSKSMRHEPSQYIELVDLIRKFYDQHEFSPNSVQDAQEYMLEHSDQLREHTLHNLTAHFFEALEIPDKTLASSMEGLDVVRRREKDTNDVRRLVKLTGLFQIANSGSDNYLARKAAQELRAQQLAMGIGNEDTQALCLRHPAIKDAYRQGQKPKWLSEQGLAPIFQAFDARIAELERIRLAGVGFVAVFRAAMLAEDESEAMEDADDLRGIMEEWNSEGNNADWDEILAIDPEWPNVVSEMLDVRIRKSRNVLRIPLDNQQDNRFIVTTRKWLAGDMTDAEFYKGTANERPQHRDLMSITKGFFNYYPDEPLPETMQKAQEFMLERPEKFREYALATLRNVTLTILETPGKSLAASYWEEFDIARHRDPNDVTRLANAFMSFIGAPDGPGGRGELQALTDLQIELGIDDDDTARFVLHFPEAEKAIFEGKSKPRWFNQQGLMSLLRLRALSAFTQTCEEAFKAEGVRAAQLTNRLRDMVERDWPNRDAFTHSLSNSQVWRESDGISPLLEEEISKTKDVLRIEVSPEQDEHFVTVAREYRASDDLDYFEQEIRAANYQYKDLLRGMGEYFHAYPRLPIPATTKAAQVWLMDSVDSTSETRTKLRPVVTMNVAADIVSFLTDDDGSGQTLAEWRQEKLNDLDITHRRSPEDVKKLAEAVMALDKAWASGPARQKRDEELTVLLTEKIGVATDERAKRLLLGRPEAAAIIKPPAGEDKKKWLDNLFDNRKLDIDRFMENLQRFSTAEGSEKLQLAYTLTMQREGVSENDWSALQNYAGELGEVDELVKEGVEQFAQAADRAGYALGESNEIESQIEAMEKKPPVDNKTLAGWMMPFIDAMDAEVSEAGQQKGESSKPSHNDINKALDNFDKRAAEITSPEAEGPALYQLNSLMDLDGEIAEKVWSVIEKERKRIVSVREKFPGKEAMLDSAFKASFKKEVESFLSELKKQHPVRADVIAAGLIRVGVPLITNLQIELPSGLAAAIEQAKRPLQCSVFEKIDEPMNGKMATALKAELLPSSLKWEQGDILDQLPPDKKSRRIESSDTFDNGLYFLRKCVSSNVAFFAHRDDKGKVEFFHKEITEMQRSDFNTSKLEPGYRYRVHPGKPVASPDIAPQQGPQRNDGSQSQQKSVKAKGGKSTGHGRS